VTQQKKEILMSPAIALLVALSFAADPAVAERGRNVRAEHERVTAEHQRFLRVYHEWQRLDRAPDAVAHLVIDPREHAMWIEDHGKVLEDFVVDIPAGYHWYAFHITQTGIAERTFPLRLTRAWRDVKDEAQEEQVWAVGVAKDQSMQITCSASRSGNGFDVGSGSMIGDVTFRLPALPSDGKAPQFDSFLAPYSPRPTQPKEELRKPEITFRVTRRSTPANAE
jgi:hypothetical protein